MIQINTSMILFTEITKNRDFVIMEDFNFPMKSWKIILATLGCYVKAVFLS